MSIKTIKLVGCLLMSYIHNQWSALRNNISEVVDLRAAEKATTEKGKRKLEQERTRLLSELTSFSNHKLSLSESSRRTALYNRLGIINTRLNPGYRYIRSVDDWLDWEINRLDADTTARLTKQAFNNAAYAAEQV